MKDPDSTGLIFDRIEVQFPPEYIKKIMGYLRYQVPSKKDMMSHSGLSPDELLQDELSVSAANVDHQSPISLPVTYPREDYDPCQFNHGHVRSPYQQLYAKQQPELAVPIGSLEHRDQSQNQRLPLDDRVENMVLGTMDYPVNYFYPNNFEGQSNVRVISQRHLNNSEHWTKTCHFFSRGYCRHGSDCRFLHVQASSDGLPSMFHGAHNDQIFLPGSLQKLELEIVEILKLWRGNPLSIAYLPTIYYETYGKVLQAEGYLTESQRQGKAGHSLTKLLSRLSSIRLIDRPHGQHAVILVEDTMKYLEGPDEATSMNSKLRQIYLTFREESTFTAEDVSKYFSTYGPVVDVRIPCQHKRTFGFVTFVHPETVQMIHAKGNPHYVCGAQVLVKHYKERSRLIDSKSQERTGFHTQPYIDTDSELHSVPTRPETLRFLQHQKLMEENAKAIEIERRNLAQLLLTRKHYQQMQMPFLANYMDARQVSNDHFNIPSASSHSHLADVPNRSSAEDERSCLKETAISSRESDLPNDLPRLLPACVINSLKKQDLQSDTAEEMSGN